MHNNKGEKNGESNKEKTQEKVEQKMSETMIEKIVWTDNARSQNRTKSGFLLKLCEIIWKEQERIENEWVKLIRLKKCLPEKCRVYGFFSASKHHTHHHKHLHNILVVSFDNFFQSSQIFGSIRVEINFEGFLLAFAIRLNASSGVSMILWCASFLLIVLEIWSGGINECPVRKNFVVIESAYPLWMRCISPTGLWLKFNKTEK